MSDNQFGRLLAAAAVFGVSYWVLSQPECQDACRAFFKPLATDAGKLAASTLATALILG